MGTFARALDKPTTGKLGLVEAASVASRDCTLLFAYKFLHEGSLFKIYKKKLSSLRFEPLNVRFKTSITG